MNKKIHLYHGREKRKREKKEKKRGGEEANG
jgi:hypothetical protein